MIKTWLMRQAGRYLPEYRELRSKHNDFWHFINTPKSVVEATLQPLRRFQQLDYAIIFSDILTIPHYLGYDIAFKKNEGPIITGFNGNIDKENFAKREDVFNNVLEGISKTKEALIKEFPNKDFIGFIGAPFTLAAYIIEGRGSKDFMSARMFAYQHPHQFSILIDALVEVMAMYLKQQIKAGVNVVKIFDSWAGLLPEEQFRKWVILPTQKIVSAVKKEYPHVPIIGFPRGAGVKYKRFIAEVDVDIIAIDQFINVDWAQKELQPHKAVQGNLDNALLFANQSDIKCEVEKIITTLGGSKEFIFNLGHGVLPNTPIENVELVLDEIARYNFR